MLCLEIGGCGGGGVAGEREGLRGLVKKNVYVFCDVVRGTNKSFMKGLLEKKTKKQIYVRRLTH